MHAQTSPSLCNHGAGLVLTSHHQWAVSTPSLRTQHAFSTMSVHCQCAVSTLTSLSVRWHRCQCADIAVSAVSTVSADSDDSALSARWHRCQHADSTVSVLIASCQCTKLVRSGTIYEKKFENLKLSFGLFSLVNTCDSRSLIVRILNAVIANEVRNAVVHWQCYQHAACAQ